MQTSGKKVFSRARTNKFVSTWFQTDNLLWVFDFFVLKLAFALVQWKDQKSYVHFAKLSRVSASVMQITGGCFLFRYS